MIVDAASSTCYTNHKELVVGSGSVYKIILRIPTIPDTVLRKKWN